MAVARQDNYKVNYTPTVNYGAFGAALLDTIGANVCDWITGGTGGIINLSSYSANLRADATAAVNSATAATLSSSANALANANTQSQTTANTAAISQLQASAASTSTGVGAMATDTFTGTYTAGTIGSDFTLGGPTGLRPWDTTGGSAHMLYSGSGYSDGTIWARHNTLMLTDNHQVQLVAAANSGWSAATWLIVRATVNLSTFVVAQVFPHQVYLGYATWNGTSYSFTAWGSPASINLTAGDVLTLGAVGTTYTLSQNSSVVLTHTDSAGNSPVGASNRYVGMAASQVSGPGFTDISWPVTSFAANDTSSPPIVGTGWSIYRSNTSGLALGATAWQQLPAGTYDTVRGGNQLVNVTNPSLGLGVIQISTAGWYAMTWTAGLTVAVGSSTVVNCGFYITPSGGSLTLARQGVAFCGSPVKSIGFGTTLYLNSGDQVSPAVYASSGALPVAGDGAGTATIFEGALVSP